MPLEGPTLARPLVDQIDVIATFLEDEDNPTGGCRFRLRAEATLHMAPQLGHLVAVDGPVIAVLDIDRVEETLAPAQEQLVADIHERLRQGGVDADVLAEVPVERHLEIPLT